MIELLNHSNKKLAKQIHSVFQASYAIEAKILKAKNFPPLQRSEEEIRKSTTTFYGHVSSGIISGVIEIKRISAGIHIQSLTVHPNYFRKGIARNLMHFTLSLFKGQDFIVETGLENAPAIHLYESIGFKETKQWDTDHGIRKIRFHLSTIRYGRIQQLDAADKTQIIALWNREYPKQLSHSGLKSFDDYLNKLSDKRHILVKDNDDNILGWLMDFVREEERWFALILSRSMQGRGIGSRCLDLVKETNKVLNGWVITDENHLRPDGSSYPSPLEFYRKNGFNVLHDQVLHMHGMSGVKIYWQL